jgi:flagellar operon protein
MNIKSVRQINQMDSGIGKSNEVDSKSTRSDFKALLANSLGRYENLKFSNHAIGRLEDRGLLLSEDRAERLSKAIDAAQAKGSRESLVLLDQLAFVVSVANRTVITACDMTNLKESVFTKIDSAVVV